MAGGIARNSSAILLVVCGAINALLSKTVYQLQAPDCSGQVKPFEKPWLQTALMFLAMALCLPIAWLQSRWQHHKHSRSSSRRAHHQQQQRRQHGTKPHGGSRASAAAATPDAAPAGASSSNERDSESLEPPLSPTAAEAAMCKAAAVGASISSLLAASHAGAAAAGSTQDSDADLRQPLLPTVSPAAAAVQRTTQQQQQAAGGRRGADGGSGNHSSSTGGSGTNNSSSSGAPSMVRQALLLCVPTAFDLAATTLMNVGLLYVAASVFQILRGAEMIFAALFAVTFLHRPLNRWHYGGVALCMVGIGCVGASRMLAGDSGGEAAAAPTVPGGNSGTGASSNGSGGGGDPKKAALGMGLILLSQAIQAGQVTVEDHLLSNLSIQPLLVVGWEGLLGSLVMLGGALPLLQSLTGRFRDGSGFAEDTRGSWCMVQQSGAIACALGLSTFAVLLYNIFGMLVTDSVGAAARVVLENARTLLVWLAALALYYTHVGGGTIGEPWDNWSWLQAVGFAIFGTGALFYNRGHKLQEDQEAAEGKTPSYSKWAVLKSTLSIATGHRVAARRFRVAGAAVLAGVRARRAANGLPGSAAGSGDGSESEVSD